MATARQRSGIRGLSKLRRTLRRIEPETTKGVRGAIENGARKIASDAKGLLTSKGGVRTGDLRDSIDHFVGRDALTATVGPGASAFKTLRRRGVSAFSTTGSSTVNFSKATTDKLWQFYKGFWFEFGTKGVPEKGIPPQPARPFMGPAFDMNRAGIEREVAAAVNYAIRRAASGV